MEQAKLNRMKNLVEIQGQSGNWDYSEYMTGMYNGMELMLSVAEDRKPEYKKSPSYNVDQEGRRRITGTYVTKYTIEVTERNDYLYNSDIYTTTHSVIEKSVQGACDEAIKRTTRMRTNLATSNWTLRTRVLSTEDIIVSRKGGYSVD